MRKMGSPTRADERNARIIKALEDRPASRGVMHGNEDPDIRQGTEFIERHHRVPAIDTFCASRPIGDIPREAHIMRGLVAHVQRYLYAGSARAE